MPYETITYEKNQNTAVLTFTTPEALNAITEQRLDELDHALDEIHANPDVRALIISGGDARAFCVGLHLDLLARAFEDLDYFEYVVRRVAGVIKKIEDLPIPTIAAVNGLARAGGFEIALGCDFLLMADEAKIGDVHTDAGVLPAASSLRLQRRIGNQKAKDVIWSARWMSGAEAVECGLALRSYPLRELQHEALRFAENFATKPKMCLAANKSVFMDGANLGSQEGADLELEVFSRYMRAYGYGKEGYTAFRENRAPSWLVNP
ncbi:enoyl-CoA hydratase/isomerase family protein [Caballeronia sordidicola]|jgi:enoyl-CoA hydratase/carnithine racemase|uniref:Enoyl-CoA hydratase n=1 Tax=Caballeronia sordidicola TaxID=196367 RepID=A0A226WQQ9_CABSO|nr:enoyl-CoA hydratase/isomerase family protein [Caballeronia sordidicola]OXC73170.1 Enoyl-CoA hydratase [Caballeronia sordidicola]